MSFVDPLWLLVLLLIPLALILQRRAEARTRRYAIRFPATGTVQQALSVTAAARWQRRLPSVAAVAALAAIAVALAHPQVTDRVPIGDSSLMMVLDHSGSMAATDVAPTRIGAAINAANQFIDQVPSNTRLGVIGFGTIPDAVQQPAFNHSAARALIDSQTANGGTDTGPALALALSLLHGAKRHHPPSAIVLLSDGAADLGEDPAAVAATARREHIPIDTVALGTANGVLNQGPFLPSVSVPPDPALMAEIARDSGGRAFDAQTADQLSSIYTTLGSRLTTVARKRDVTAEVALVAAALLLIAGLVSVRTAARLP